MPEPIPSEILAPPASPIGARRWDLALLIGAAALLWVVPLCFDRSLHRVFDISKSTTFRVLVTVLGVAWACRVLLHGLPRPAAARVFALPLLALLVATALSTALSIDPVTSLLGSYQRQLGLYGLLGCVLITFVLATTLRDRRDCLALLGALSAMGGFVGLVAVLQGFGIAPFGLVLVPPGRAASTLGHPNFAGNLLATLVPVAAVLCFAATTLPRRLLHAVAAALMLAGMIFTRTRGAWAGAGLGVFVLLCFSPVLAERKDVFQRMLRWTGPVVVGLVALGVAMAAFVLAEGPGEWALAVGALALAVGVGGWLYRADGRPLARRVAWLAGAALAATALAALLCRVLAPGSPTLAHFLSIFDVAQSPRFALWRDTLAVVAERPWLGSGPETFAQAFMPHKSVLLEMREPNSTFDNPHNNYLYVLATTGLAGLCAYLWLLGRWLRRTLVALCDAAQTRDERAIALGLFASAVSYLAWSVPGFDTVATSMTLFALLGISAAWVSRTEPVSHPPAGRRRIARALAIPLVLAVGAGSLWAALSIYRADRACRDALVLVRQGSFAAAIETLGRARSHNPFESFYALETGRTYLAWARTVAEEGRRPLLAQAEVALNDALEHASAPGNVYVSLFHVRMFARDLDGSIHAARRALDHDPYKASLRADLGVLLQAKGDFVGASENLDLALRVDPASARAYFGLGAMRLAQGDLTAAEVHLAKAAALPSPTEEHRRQIQRVLSDVRRRRSQLR